MSIVSVPGSEGIAYTYNPKIFTLGNPTNATPLPKPTDVKKRNVKVTENDVMTYDSIGGFKSRLRKRSMRVKRNKKTRRSKRAYKRTRRNVARG